jgi:small-conductance mechanosensitive channel
MTKSENLKVRCEKLEADLAEAKEGVACDMERPRRVVELRAQLKQAKRSLRAAELAGK